MKKYLKWIVPAVALVIIFVFALPYMNGGNLKGYMDFNSLSSYQKQMYWQMMDECIPMMSDPALGNYRTCALNTFDKASKLKESASYCKDTDGIDYETKGIVTSDLYPDGIEDYAYTFSNGKTYLFEGACSSDNKYMYYQKNCKELGEDYVVKDGACVDDKYCNQNSFNAAFMLIYENEAQLTKEVLWKVDKLKNDFSKAFSIATDGLASMSVDNDLLKMKATKDFFYMPEVFGNDYLEIDYVSKQFYKTHDDSYDFLIIVTTFGGSEEAANNGVSYDILGIGLDDEISNLSKLDMPAKYGSSGRLKSVINMNDINYLNFGDGFNPQNLLLHEVGHQWCCYVGDDMQGGLNNEKLEIRQEGIHFYLGLDSPYKPRTPLGARYWNSNGDTTFSVEGVGDGKVQKYHPFVLYFMGLLPESQYSTKYSIYNAGYSAVPGQSSGNTNLNNASYYKSVSVNDIIAVEGARKCK